MSRSDKIYLVDGSSFLYRAYYGTRPLQTSQGVPVNAVYSFCRMLKKILDAHKPGYIALVWDGGGATARHEQYAEYKKNRLEPPSDLAIQRALIKDFASAINIAQYEQVGIEADDILYALAKQGSLDGYKIVILTSDKDLGQAVSDTVVLYDFFKDRIKTRELLEQEYAFSLDRLPLYFALVGDSSDNIPGVSGVGPKTATQLAQKYSSLDELYTHLDHVRPEKLQKKLSDNRHLAYMSYNLFVPQKITIKPDYVRMNTKNVVWEQARTIFVSLEFESLLREMGPVLEFIQPVCESICVTTASQLYLVAESIKQIGLCSIDTETTGSTIYNDTLVGISICVHEGHAWYIPCGHVTGETQLTVGAIRDILGPIFSDANIKKIFHNAKFDLHFLAQAGINIAGLQDDSLIASSLLVKDGQRIGLKYVSKFFLNESMASYEQVVTDRGYGNFAEVPLAVATPYAATDAHQTLRVRNYCAPLLVQEGVYDIYQQIEMPLVTVLCSMEARGIRINPLILQEAERFVDTRLQELLTKISMQVGVERDTLNLNSHKVVQNVLFERLGLPRQRKTATGYSTDQEVLEYLGKTHEVPRLISEYRELAKLQSTYIQALPKFINPKTGRVHAQFNQVSTATGRLSSSDPNMQNIPKDSTGPGSYIRRSVIPDEGNIFVGADYSQIELKVVAYLSQDPRLLEAFFNNIDVHTHTAAGIFSCPPDQVTAQMRAVGKRINFSVLYGITPYGLSHDLGVSMAQAHDYITRFFSYYAGVRLWMDNTIAFARQYGYVATYGGRRRYIPGISEKNKNLYEAACRIAINTVGQGTAAEIVKRGMIAVHNKLLEVPGAALIVQVHDEIIVETPVIYSAQVVELVKNSLERVVDWNVPLTVTVRVGNTWQDV